MFGTLLIDEVKHSILEFPWVGESPIYRLTSSAIRQALHSCLHHFGSGGGCKSYSKVFSFCECNNWLENQSIGGNIWVLWRENIQIEPILLTDKMITMKVHFYTNVCFVFAVYAHCLYARRRELWESFMDLHPAILEPWVWGEDFNIIRMPEEQSGGRGVRPLRIAMREFNTCIDHVL